MQEDSGTKIEGVEVGQRIISAQRMIVELLIKDQYKLINESMDTTLTIDRVSLTKRV